ncbi:hypothetical protein PIB30_046442 [Stylosanthes scabra]|uniref:Uncharacterized protein n=1 Tax=Stylosanthes scabra TaxID=79078 RepID=A0ABU6YF84_9FABA|nr:hypothetical protein [Stylosanthes scabra]
MLGQRRNLLQIGNFKEKGKNGDNQAGQGAGEASQSRKEERIVLTEMVTLMNTEENIFLGEAHTHDNFGFRRLKQVARQKGGNGKAGCGSKRVSTGKENDESRKRICLEEMKLKEAEVEGARRQVAPKEI